jgi:acyl-CoA synthetase (AMP-forming)/AMP-acid ligase II
MDSTTIPTDATTAAADQTDGVAARVNVADRLTKISQIMPQAVAIAEVIGGRRGARKSKRQYKAVSFEWLDTDSSAIAAGLISLGVTPGMRLALLVRPGIEFVALVFALLKSGAIQVLIDPGMGMRRVLKRLAEIEPQGFIAIPQAQTVRAMVRKKFPNAKLNVSVGRRLPWSNVTLADVRRMGLEIIRASNGEIELPNTTADDPAAIIFTSGSTGPAKGVLYRHANFDRQVVEIRDFYGIQPGELDVPCFPLFGLFNAAMGVTSVIPAMDFTRPARVDPRNIIAAVNDWQATQAFGSPAVWNRVGQFCEQQKIQLLSLRRVLSAGAPVSARVLKRMTACIHPEGDMHTPYGATEALPVASISASEVVDGTQRLTEMGLGVCVGMPFGGIEWRVIRVHDGAIERIDDATELPTGEIGELIVRGPQVTTEYVDRPDATQTAKIYDDNDTGAFWHRMGDVGYLDQQNRFWFCGRMSQRVETANGPMFTIPSEAIFNRHPSVFRSALVGVGPKGSQQPAIVVEPLPGCMPRGRKQREALIAELRALGQSEQHTAAIEHIFLMSLPVDVRHNVKINRELLAVWAAKKLRGKQ